MKALTVRQPWASLIAAGVKTIETRSQRTNHRGLLAIHAGLHRPVEGEDVGDWWWNDSAGDPECIVRRSQLGLHPAPLGAVVAVAEVVDCLPIVPEKGCSDVRSEKITISRNGEYLTRFKWCNTYSGRGLYSGREWSCQGQLPYGDFTPGRWSWLLAEVRPLPEPVACRGAQGLWNVPADVEATVLAQIGEAVPA